MWRPSVDSWQERPKSLILTDPFSMTRILDGYGVIESGEPYLDVSVDVGRVKRMHVSESADNAVDGGEDVDV